MAKINMSKFTKAVENSGGIMSTIATRLRVTRRGLYQWVEKHPEATELIKEESEKILDFAENKLLDIVAGDTKDSTTLGATKYLLSTKGKSRGYVEQKDIKTEHSGSIGVTEIKVVMANEDDISSNEKTDDSLQEAN